MMCPAGPDPAGHFVGHSPFTSGPALAHKGFGHDLFHGRSLFEGLRRFTLRSSPIGQIEGQYFSPD
ncbi:hypothetical protein [Croceicoccus hydrothermalis]|uniref:hypothetical protein n=1 Tax=Croceicoccus hydrothermalis TaxID=2867964 RepID=UPI001EFB1E15|nr:hypothetical protein [Croceicoccus hydrothermalis]